MLDQSIRKLITPTLLKAYDSAIARLKREYSSDINYNPAYAEQKFAIESYEAQLKLWKAMEPRYNNYKAKFEKLDKLRLLLTSAAEKFDTSSDEEQYDEDDETCEQAEVRARAALPTNINKPSPPISNSNVDMRSTLKALMGKG